MTVEEAYKTLKDPKMSKFECNFKVKSKQPGESKPPKYFSEFKKQMLEFQKQMLEFQKQMLDFVKEQKTMWKQQLEFNQFVVEQFKQHGWVK